MARALRLIVVLAAALALAGPLAACGKKGDPRPPAERDEYPRQYPR